MECLTGVNDVETSGQDRQRDPFGASGLEWRAHFFLCCGGGGGFKVLKKMLEFSLVCSCSCS